MVILPFVWGMVLSKGRHEQEDRGQLTVREERKAGGTSGE
jgi:hypothetical protein